YATTDGAQLVLYEPQIASWDNQRKMTAYSAASYLKPGTEMPMLGTLTLEADTRVSVEERLVDFSSLQITQSNFPGASKDDIAAAVAAVKVSVPLRDRVLALDRVLAF